MSGLARDETRKHVVHGRDEHWTWIELDPDYDEFCGFWIGSGLKNAPKI